MRFKNFEFSKTVFVQSSLETLEKGDSLGTKITNEIEIFLRSHITGKLNSLMAPIVNENEHQNLNRPSKHTTTNLALGNQQRGRSASYNHSAIGTVRPTYWIVKYTVLIAEWLYLGSIGLVWVEVWLLLEAWSTLTGHESSNESEISLCMQMEIH